MTPVIGGLAAAKHRRTNRRIRRAYGQYRGHGYPRTSPRSLRHPLAMPVMDGRVMWPAPGSTVDEVRTVLAGL